MMSASFFRHSGSCLDAHFRRPHRTIKCDEGILVAGIGMRELTIQGADSLRLSLAVFESDDSRATLQIIHGEKEHKGRYYDFAKYLAGNGINVVVSDNRGHGASVNGHYPLGHMGDMKTMMNDQFLVSQFAKSVFPKVDLSLMGYSFGACIARAYLREHDSEIRKLILVSPPRYSTSAAVGCRLGRIAARVGGENGHNRLFLKYCKPREGRTICTNVRTVEARKNDALCTGYDYTNASYSTLWDAGRMLHDVKGHRCTNRNLRILSVSGANDPLTGGERGLDDNRKTLRKIGYTRYRSIVYSGMKHDVLGELDCRQAWNDISGFVFI